MTSHKPLNVLAVDDDELIQCTMQALLEILGHRVTIATCGEDALAKIQAGFEPDVVILDMNMPGLGGAGTLPRLRILRPQLPVLLATGRVDQAASDLATAYPFVTLLPKPYRKEDLQRCLESLAMG
jgi:CheY-like chemotaxis protein